MSRRFIKNIFLTIIFILALGIYVFAQEVTSSVNKGYSDYKEIPEFKKKTVIFGHQETEPFLEPVKKGLSELQKTAREYRAKGLEFQKLGNLDQAIVFYQKAIELDPAYVIAYNDLGIIYEAKGFFDLAEASYLKAIQVDPNYLSPYSNLALFYENKREFEKAAFYWQRRLELGSSDDPWTQKARKRLEDIQLVLGKKTLKSLREQEVVDLIKDVSAQKDILREDDKALARVHLEKAKRYFTKDEYTLALKEAMEAMQLDPSCAEIENFIRKIHTRMLQ
ncbi:MAG: tetratricopeptide repeat protein [Candidatus Omnitrophica bacterium]|nr:tetratricopeptide repeat protein [Candidatus Omnitrophota bacterium]